MHLSLAWVITSNVCDFGAVTCFALFQNSPAVYETLCFTPLITVFCVCLSGNLGLIIFMYGICLSE